MTLYYDFSHTVGDDEMDSQGHVHNLRYIQWTLAAAGEHSEACGWNKKAALSQGLGWVVRSHEITYRAAARSGDEVVVRTWISDINQYASRRKYTVCRVSDRVVLARVVTRWVYVDLTVHRVVPIPSSLLSQIAVCSPAPGLPWE